MADAAQKHLRSFIDRVERLEEEAKAINADKSEVYKEAKEAGFDVKAMKEVVRRRRKEPAEREEHEALVDLYFEAMVSTDPSRAHARAA